MTEPIRRDPRPLRLVRPEQPSGYAMDRTPAVPPAPAAESSPEPQAPRGLECRECGCRRFRVVYTRARANAIMRRRECEHCGRPVTTVERAV